MTARLSRRAFFTRQPPAPQPPAAFLVRVHRQIMACRVEVVLPGERAADLHVASAALDEGDRLEDVMTIFRPSSELSRVNREAHAGPVSVSDDLFSVLWRAAALAEATGGAFDITSTPLSQCWGFLRREGRMPAADEIDRALACVGTRLVALAASARTVHFRQAGVRLNLGSIGKGFALDRMGQLLASRGIPDALLSAGSSSILARGGRSAPWQVDLRTATTGDVLAHLRLVDAAVGTSGAGQQFFIADGRRFGHVIDPRTGWPATGTLSASVITSDAASADALATAMLIGGTELASRYCAAHPGVLAIVTPDDETRRPVLFGSRPGASVELA
jgi:thiamine biosynthesis lipoprotein